DREDARLPLRRVPRRGSDARPARRAASLRVEEPLMGKLEFDIAHLLAGGLVLMSLLLLYQDRMFALLRFFAGHGIVLSLAVAWQAYIQAKPELYIPAVIALAFKGIVIPLALYRIVVRLGIHRELETVVGVGLTMLAGMGLIGLSLVVIL